MRVPKHLNVLTVDQFQECESINNNPTTDKYDKGILLLSALTGKTIDEIESIPQGKLTVKVAQAHNLFLTKLSEEPKRFIMIGWRIYRAIHNAKELRELMSTNQFTAHAEYTKTGDNKNLHLILPLMYTPLFNKGLAKNQTKHAGIFKRAKVGDVSGTAFFFSKLHDNFVPVLIQERDKAMETIANHMEEVMTSGLVSEKSMGGTKR